MDFVKQLNDYFSANIKVLKKQAIKSCGSSYEADDYVQEAYLKSLNSKTNKQLKYDSLIIKLYRTELEEIELQELIEEYNNQTDKEFYKFFAKIFKNLFNDTKNKEAKFQQYDNYYDPYSFFNNKFLENEINSLNEHLVVDQPFELAEQKEEEEYRNLIRNEMYDWVAKNCNLLEKDLFKERHVLKLSFENIAAKTNISKSKIFQIIKRIEFNLINDLKKRHKRLEKINLSNY